VTRDTAITRGRTVLGHSEPRQARVNDGVDARIRPPRHGLAVAANRALRFRAEKQLLLPSI
jgi:hypothetical protein